MSKVPTFQQILRYKAIYKRVVDRQAGLELIIQSYITIKHLLGAKKKKGDITIARYEQKTEQ